MRLTPATCLAAIVALACVAPAAAQADGSWSCGAGGGWVAANGQRADAPRLDSAPCATQQGAAGGATGVVGSGQGRLYVDGTIATDAGGSDSQTTDTRPKSSITSKTAEIHNSDDSLIVTASKLAAQAAAECDPSRKPLLSSSGSPGTVTLNGRPVDTSRDYSEPGVGVNGAPLFGKITIKFNEVEKNGDTGLTRRELHVIVTDRDGKVVFEAAAGEVAIGRDGNVCEPPPICPPGQEPQAGRCVNVAVTPLPTPPPPLQTPPPGGSPPSATQPPGSNPNSRLKKKGCRDADARAGQVSTKRLRTSTLCLMNVERKKRHLGRLRSSSDLALAAAFHARDMLKRRYFSHDEPTGPGLLGRVLKTGYLERYGSWRLGENLGWGWGTGATPRAMVAAWLRSPGHRRNMLAKNFQDVGIAVVFGTPRKQRAVGAVTYVIDFGGFIVHRR